MSGFAEDPWTRFRRLTPARIALGRSGSGLPTSEVLRFALAHAQARDAVHASLDPEGLSARLGTLGLAPLVVRSAAPDRATYLRRPDLGRRLSEESRAALADPVPPHDLAIVVADGLSAPAVAAHAPPLLDKLVPRLDASGLRLGPVVVAIQARVALGDDVGARLRSRAVLVLIGERPGLSSPDSLGAYLTFDPRPGRTDAERNCLSNIRDGGLSADEASFKLSWLLDQALTRGLTGVALKDESDLAALGPAGRAALPG